MSYKAIIFDLDGTIVDTEHIWERATTALITKRNIVITPEIARELRAKICGLATPYTCRAIKDLFHFPETVEELVAEKYALVDKFYQEGISFIRGFITFHQQITKKYGLLSGIATNADTRTVALTKQLVPLNRFFGEHIYSIDSVNNVPKPNPDLYLHAVQKLGLTPECCIAIEDSINGITAAKNAGLFCIGLNSAKQRSLLENAQPNFIVDRYHQIDIPRLLKKN